MLIMLKLYNKIVSKKASKIGQKLKWDEKLNKNNIYYA